MFKISVFLKSVSLPYYSRGLNGILAGVYDDFFFFQWCRHVEDNYSHDILGHAFDPMVLFLGTPVRMFGLSLNSLLAAFCAGTQISTSSGLSGWVQHKGDLQ